MARPGTEHYVKSVEFRAQLAEYYKTDEMPDYLPESLQKIATGLSFSPNFINYSYKDEMIGDAIQKMWIALRDKKFNIESESNPFSYFTTIAWNAFINRIKKEQKHADTLKRYKESVYEAKLTESNCNIYVRPLGDDESDYYGDE